MLKEISVRILSQSSNEPSIRRLLKKNLYRPTLVQLTGVQEQQCMNCAYCGECDRVGDLVFSKEGAAHTDR